MSKKVRIIGCVAVLVTGLTGSAQDLNENDVIDSGFAGVFAEYDAEHNLIASYMMDVEKGM